MGKKKLFKMVLVDQWVAFAKSLCEAFTAENIKVEDMVIFNRADGACIGASSGKETPIDFSLIKPDAQGNFPQPDPSKNWEFYGRKYNAFMVDETYGFFPEIYEGSETRSVYAQICNQVIVLVLTSSEKAQTCAKGDEIFRRFNLL